MERRSFIKKCGIWGGSCIGITLFIESCSTTHYVQSKLINNAIQIEKSNFIKIKGEKTSFRKYIVVKFEGSDFPIIVYRKTDSDYSALLLRCTHQGNELNINGDLLTCAAHGSEFGVSGEVVKGPAEEQLKSFPVSTNGDSINIHITQ